MRVIAGLYRGRTLKSPTWEGLRPTSDRLRETLFNVLAPRVAGARVLDGFAGTGAVGIEALSRGAAHVTFVERDPRAVALIEENLRRCGIADRYAIIRANAATLRPTPAESPYDLIVLDPPYAAEADTRAALVAAAGRLAPDGLLVLERAARTMPGDVPGFDRVRDLKSGDSALTFYVRQRQEP